MKLFIIIIILIIFIFFFYFHFTLLLANSRIMCTGIVDEHLIITEGAVTVTHDRTTEVWN